VRTASESFYAGQSELLHRRAYFSPELDHRILAAAVAASAELQEAVRPLRSSDRTGACGVPVRSAAAEMCVV
jgi:hypothetical protein